MELVKNEEAYEKYLEAKRLMEEHPDRNYIDSKGRLLVLTSSMGAIKKNIQDLPKKEQNVIVEKATAIARLKGQMIALKRKVNSKDGNSYEDPFEVLNERSSEIIELFGKWMTTEEVHKTIMLDWNMTSVGCQIVKKFALRHKETINKLRAQYDADYTDVSVASKRSRLSQLNYLLQDRRQIYETTHKVDDSKEIRAILADARKEIEGEQLLININGRIEVDATITLELQNKIQGGLSLSQMIVARVAARIGKDPTFMMSRLANSVYAKFNGFQKNDNIEVEKPIYPSAMVYDWELIKNKKEVIEEAKVIDSLPKEQIESSSKIKELLMQKIKSTNRQIKDIKEKDFV